MSLIITIYCSEGIVMASDSRTTYYHTDTIPPMKEGSPSIIIEKEGVNFTDTTYKTFLSDNGIGVSTCGASSIEGKPIAGFIEQFLRANDKLSVKETAIKLQDFFGKKSLDKSATFIVAGYEEDENNLQQVIYRVRTTNSDIEIIDTSNQGALWSGEVDIISRITKDLFVKTGTEEYIEYPASPIPWNFFTLQDCIDFAEYAIKATIDTMWFQTRVKTVGGPIDILVIKPSGPQWISHKELHTNR